MEYKTLVKLDKKLWKVASADGGTETVCKAYGY